MIVQIYETQNGEEARRLVEAGVDHVGVLVGKGEYPREFAPEEASAIFRCVAGRARTVALSLFGNVWDIAAIVNETKPDVLHLGATPESLSPDDVRAVKRQFPGLPVMRSIPVTGERSVELARQYDGVADYLLLDTQGDGETQVGATGETHDWRISRRIVESVGAFVILAGGLGPENVAEAIRAVRPFGVDSKSRTDKAGGHEKDIEKVRQFVARAKGWR